MLYLQAASSGELPDLVHDKGCYPAHKHSLSSMALLRLLPHLPNGDPLRVVSTTLLRLNGVLLHAIPRLALPDTAAGTVHNLERS